MKTLFYSLRQVLKLRISNLFKLISLTLGIAIGGAILCWVAYQNSYDTWLKDYKNIGFLMAQWQIGDNPNAASGCKTQGPVAPELMATVPAVVKATRTQPVGTLEFRHGDKTIQMNGILVDSLFFDVLQIDILSGDYRKALENPKEVMISRSAAIKTFGDLDVIGKEILYGENAIVYTVAGVYEDIPNNSHMDKYEFVMRSKRFADYWDGGDRYITYFLCAPGTNFEKLTDQINTAFVPRMEPLKKNGFSITYTAVPITDATYYMNEQSPMKYIAMALALMILIVSALNFALMEISSLVSRAKEVGVHKTSGATTSQVFMLVIWETVIYTILGLTLAACLIYSAKGHLEGMMGNFNDIFSFSSLWILGVVLVGMVFIAGVLPAVIFARIPAMEVFRKFTGNNLWWKQGLLFVQFTLSVVTICTLIGANIQYNLLTSFDLGYNHEKLAVAHLYGSSEANRQTLKTELQKLPYVDKATICTDAPTEGLSGIGVFSNTSDEMILSARSIGIDPDFFETYGIKVLEGDPQMMGDSSAMVNPRLLEVANTSLGDNTIRMEGLITMGIFEDFRTNLYVKPQPIILYRRPVNDSYVVITIRTVQKLTAEQRSEVNGIIKKVFPNKEFTIKTYDELINSMYQELRSIRDMLILGSLVLILILVLGMVSYIATDIKARAREIAIRRTHGATTWEIITFVARRIFIVAVISCVVAIPAVYFIIDMMQSFFFEKADIGWWVYAVGVLFIMGLIILSTYIQTYRIAHRDYVKIIGKA